MDSQEKKMLMDYMKAAIDLETDIATQKSIIQLYTENSQARKPVLYLQDEPQKPEHPTVVEYHGDWSRNSEDGATWALAFGIIFAFFGLIMVFATNFSLISVIIFIAALCCFIPFIKKKKLATKINESNYKNYSLAMDEYKSKLERINGQNNNAKKTYGKNLRLWENNTKENCEELQLHLKETQSLLDALYSKGFIYPKYQNLPALSSIYEYLLSGRCEDLTGPHGAYNLYEDEVRKDTVISQLNIVIENLEQIKNNQYMLYQQAKKISENTTAIKSELDVIRDYTIRLSELTALNTYYSALTASNASICATMHLLNG